MFNVLAVGNRRHEAYVQFHQEVGADGHVEGFGEVRRFKPRRDSSDPCDISLDNLRGPMFEVLAKMSQRVN